MQIRCKLIHKNSDKLKLSLNRMIVSCYIVKSLFYTSLQSPTEIPSQDDVLGVVNHIDQMVTLLMLELREPNSHNHYRQSNSATHSPCLEYLLSENLLVKLYNWSIHTGRYIIPTIVTISTYIIYLCLSKQLQYNISKQLLSVTVTCMYYKPHFLQIQ